ncbi:hypothetical protein GZH46_00860 [Fragariocoptes setiger]|uniref:Uncharacterized protein n=1 Tax=Fragariocoptes setiger TaxID=1670756 RepID=A0ABQ7SB00_9ACAR|nr:hypothetical protein GZH46_00860 [Fragariocoptes setiger]
MTGFSSALSDISINVPRKFVVTRSKSINIGRSMGMYWNQTNAG